MTFSEMAALRQSCRKYARRPVEREKLTRMLDTARLAPSACNSQEWHMTVVAGERAPEFAEFLQNNGMNKFTSGVPAFVVISQEELSKAAKMGESLLHQPYKDYDAGILAAHLCYAAQEQGLSCCIVGWFDEQKIQQFIGLEKKICLVLCVGYADEGEPHRDKVRKPLDEVATFL